MDSRKDGFDFRAVRLVDRRQHQALAEALRGFIDGEARWVGREFEQHAGGLPKVDRVEVLAVDHRGGLEACLNDLLPQLELGRIVSDAPSDVMHGTRALDSLGKAPD